MATRGARALFLDRVVRRVVVAMARLRIRLWRHLTCRLMGPLSGPIPMATTIYAPEDVVADTELARHVEDQVMLDPATVVDYAFAGHVPLRFRRSWAFETKALYVLNDVCVSPASGAAWFPHKRGLLRPSVGSLDRLMRWPGMLHERLLPAEEMSTPTPILVHPPVPYYHWLLETLPNTIYGLAHDPAARVLVPPNLPRYVVDGLTLLLGDDDLARRLLTKSNPVRVNRLILAQLEPESRFVRPADVQLVTSTLRARADLPDARPSLALYVSRSGSPKRKVENELELEEGLAALGFQIVCCERLSLTEQIRLFSAAGTIVGLHGAGLSNLIWAQPPCQVVELFPWQTFNSCYAHLALMLGLGYDFIECQPGETRYGRIPVTSVVKRFA